MALEISNVSFGYGSVSILQDVSLRVEPGEIVGLKAPSGRGKSTLAKIAAGYIRPKSGEVLVDGDDLQACRGMLPVQMIHQHPELSLDPSFTIRNSLYEAWDVDEKTIWLFGVEKEWLDRYPSELSGGQIQRVCLARTLAPTVKYLIADEITTMVDAISQVSICMSLKHLADDHGLGVLFISHDDSLLNRICTRIIEL